MTYNNLCFYNLHNKTSLRNIKKAVDAEITIENIKYMDENDFIRHYGNTNHTLYALLKAYSKTYKPSAIQISIYALFQFDISENSINSLYDAGLTTIFSLYTLSESELINKYHVKERSKKIILENRHKIDITKNDIIYDFKNLDKIPKEIYNYYKNIVYKSIDDFEPTEIETIKKNIPSNLDSIGLTELILDDLIRNNKIKKDNTGYFKCHLTLKEFVSTLDNSRESNCFKMHISGKSLDEVGKEIELSRERARQLIKKVNIPVLEENKYFKYFYLYDINLDIFSDIFNIGIEEANYVFKYAKGIKGTKKLEEITDDSSVSDDVKERALKYIKIYIIDNNRIVANVTSLFKYYLFKYVRESKSIDELYKGFNLFLKDYKDEKEPSFRLFSNMFEYSKCAILGANGYRYYNYQEYDLNEALKDIDLSVYNNKEISTKVLFNAYKGIMDSIDIRDEHELHMLMKKTGNYPNVKFERTPMIIIGSADRNKQILDLLVEFDNQSVKDFVTEYSKVYGAKENSFNSYFSTNFTKYIYNSKIKLNIPELSEAEVDKIKTLLTEDYYLISEVKEIFANNNITFEQKYLYPRNISRIGYIAYSQFMVKRSYGSAQNYFDSLFLSETIDFTQNYRKYFWNLQFIETLYNNLKKGVIYQIKPRKYVREAYLNNKNITKEIIKEFIEDVKKFTNDNRIFTIESIVTSGFDSKILSLINEKFLLCGLLQYSNEFSYLRFGYSDNYIFKIKTDGKNIKIQNLIEQIVKENNILSLEDVLAKLDYYGISIQKNKVIGILNELK